MSPFNLLSISRLPHYLDYVISFTKYYVCLHDWSSRQVINIKCESYGLYHLRPCTHVDAIMESQSLHASLGHLSLAKLQQFVPSLSMLSSLVCESCQLRKYSCSSFPHSVSQCVLSPFSLVHSSIWGLSRVKSNLGF